MQLTSSLEKLRKEVFTKDEPLGPTHLEGERDFVPELLVTENEPYLRLVDNPTFLVGRKGSGKSSLLYSTCLNESTICLELPSDDMFTEIVRYINSNTDAYTTVEQVESVWSFAFLVAMSAKLVDHFGGSGSQDQDMSYLKLFLKVLGVDSCDQPFLVILDSLKSLNADDSHGMRFEHAARYWSKNGLSRSDIELAIVGLLSRKGKKLRVLVDSIEEYKLDEEGAFPALSGFIRYIGQFRSHSNRVYVQCALPSEVYFVILEQISTNPAKDFSRIELVHWTSAELLYLAARRLLTYIYLYNESLYDRSFRHLDGLKGRSFSRKFWARILPGEIENRLGIKENTEAYIVRHTQLCPRHIIQYFNEIVRISSDDILSGRPLRAETIVHAIKETEERLCDDVFAGWSHNYHLEAVDYRYQGYPNARKLCAKILPYLPYKFSYSEFRSEYRIRVSDSISYIAGEEDALRLLLEIGAVGRVTNRVRSTDRYVLAEFEYALPSRLRYTTNSEFAIHPAFIGTFSPEEMEPKPPYAVYPIGSDPSDPDHRERMS